MRRSLCFFFCASPFLAQMSWAQADLYWRNPEASSGNWSGSSNWWNGSSGVAPAGDENLHFDNNHLPAMTNDLAGPAANRFTILFEPGASVTRTIGGATENTFFDFGTIRPKIENTSSAAHVLNFPVKIGFSGGMEINPVSAGLTIGGAINTDGKTLYVYGNGGHTLNLNGAISGGGGLTVQQNSVVVLGTGNSFSGPVQVNAGILRPTSTGSLPVNPVIGATGSLDLNGIDHSVVSRDVTLGGLGVGGGVPGALYNSSGAESRIRNILLSAASRMGTNSGKLNVGGTINGGGNTLYVGGSGETNLRPGSSLVNLPNVHIDTTGGGRLRFESSQSPASGVTLHVQSGGRLDTYGTVSQNANLGINLNGGILEANGTAGGFTATWNGPVAVSANSQIITNKRIDFFGGMSGAGTVVKSGGDVLNLRGGVSSLGGLVINAGRVRLENTGLGGWTGPVTVNTGGILSNYNNQNTSAAITLAGGTLGTENNGTGTHNGSFAVSSASTVDAAGNGIVVIGGPWTGSGNLNKTGSGTFQLTGNATGYAGTLTASVGVVRPTVVNTALPTNLAIASGASLDLNGLAHTARSVTLAGNGVSGVPGALFNSSGAESWIGNITLSAAARIGTNSGKLNTGGTLNGGGHTLTVGGSGETNFRPSHTLVNLPDIQVSTTGSGRLRFEGDSHPAASVMVHVNSGAIADTWATRAMGSNLALHLNGGTLAANGGGGTFTATWAGPVTVAAHSTVLTNKDIVFDGAVGGGSRLTKTGAGILSLANAANTLTGPIFVNGGTLRIGTGDEQTLGNNPGAFTADQLRLNNGTLHVTGSSLTLNDSNRGLSIGTVGLSVGTAEVDSGLTLTVANPIAGANGNLRKAGAGTFNLTAPATFNGLLIDAGAYTQSSGVTTINTVSTGLQIASGAAYHLNGGRLATDVISVAGGGSFNWGAGALTVRSTIGSSGTADYSSGGFQLVRTGTQLTVNGDLDTSTGSTLQLHASPSFYLDNGVRFNALLVQGNLDLTSADDALAVEISPYLLRPFSPSLGTGAVESGSLPLVVVSGSLTGTFDTFGTVINDGLGFSPHVGAFSGLGDLANNTWHLEYVQNVDNPAGYAPGTYDLILFHYRVTGYVPEPETFLLGLVGLVSLRYTRRWRKATTDRVASEPVIRREAIRPARRHFG
jgi:autotransporter-associated beta strand protein